MSLRSNNIVSEHDTRSINIVSKRDTPVQYSVETWHSDLKISCRNVTLQSTNIINYHLLSLLFHSLIIFHQAFFIQGITSIERFSDYKSHDLRILVQSQITQPSHTITQLHIELHSITQWISVTIKSISIQKNKP